MVRPGAAGVEGRALGRERQEKEQEKPAEQGKVSEQVAPAVAALGPALGALVLVLALLLEWRGLPPKERRSRGVGWLAEKQASRAITEMGREMDTDPNGNLHLIILRRQAEALRRENNALGRRGR